MTPDIKEDAKTLRFCFLTFIIRKLMDSDEENKCPKLITDMNMCNLAASVGSENRICNERNARRPTIVDRFLMLEKGDISDSSTCSSTSSTPNTPLSVGSSPVKLRDLPHTTTLKGCCAYVDVWSSNGTDNCSSVFRNFLTRMGATVYRKLTKDYSFTHVIFKDGHKSVLQKAKKRNIKVVTCLWVERCRVLEEWVDEKDYLFDPTSYRPPKRFVEMQPQDPEEYIRKSEERLKRRKARFAKKHTRIMYQSPLTTHSTNGTPTGSRTPIENNNNKWKNVILAANTPRYPPSPLPFFYPSFVRETPLTDSMQRKLKRLKEGKRILSPPTSSDENEEIPDKKSMDRPYNKRNNRENGTPDSSTSCHTSTSKLLKFSPIPDTQFYCDKPRRRHAIAPPNFNISIDEIPETQAMESEENNLMDEKKDDIFLDENEINPQEKCNDPNSSTIEPESQPSLYLHVSTDSSICNDMTVLNIHKKEQEANEKPVKKSKELSRLPNKHHKRKRKLLNEADDQEPVSFLLSPKSDIANYAEAEDQEKSTTIHHDTTKENPLELPQLGCSAFNTISTNGQYFTQLPAHTPSDNSESAISYKISSTQSTEYDLNQVEVFPEDLTLSNSCLSMYDRIKTKKRAVRAINDTDVLESPRKRRKKIVSGDAYEKAIFQSQMAVSILDEMKRRRSTMDFATHLSKDYEISRKRRPKKAVIVLTNLHSHERSEITKAISTLGTHCLTSSVNNSTTHVVSGESRRTISVLQAISRGLWLLSVNWVKDSLSAGFWLDEESYEVPSILPVAQKNRIARQACGLWSNTVFSQFKGHLYIADDTKPSQVDLCQLISLCGGNTVGSLRRAAICVGNPGRTSMNDIPVVKETWLLDCITANSLLPISKYLISRC